MVISELKLHKHRSSTRKNYYNIWKKFNEFFLKLDIKPTSWEDRLVLFMGYLANENMKASMIKSYILAIKAVLQSIKVELKLDEVLLNSLTRACRLINDRIKTRLPIKIDVLQMLLCNMHKLFKKAPQPYLCTLYKAMLITAYYRLFRISEITVGPHVILAVNVHVGINKDKMMFVLFSSKTHNESDKPQIIKIKAEGQGSDPDCCPFKLIKEYLKVRPRRDTEEEPFFIFKDRSGVKACHFRNMLKNILKICGLNHKMYSSHGICAGRAMQLFELGVSVETIRKLGRWKSSSIYAYLRA